MFSGPQLFTEWARQSTRVNETSGRDFGPSPEDKATRPSPYVMGA